MQRGATAKVPTNQNLAKKGVTSKNPFAKIPSLPPSQPVKSLEVSKTDATIIPQVSPLDRPLNISDSLKLLSDVIALSKYFLIDKSPSGKSIPVADKLIGRVLNLDKDLKEQKDPLKKDNIAAAFITMAKAELFSYEKLNSTDRLNLAKFGFINPQQNETVPQFLEKKAIDGYISYHVKKDYQETLLEIVDRTCKLCVIGFASYNLLMARRDYDKELIANGQTRLTAHDAKDMMASEKNKIVRLVAALAKKKTKSTKAGEIASIEIEIASDASHIRDKYDAIEEKLKDKSLNTKEKQIEILTAGILRSKALRESNLIESIPNQQLSKINTKLVTEKQKSSKDLLIEIAAIEEENAFVLAENLAQQQLLKERALAAETNVAQHQAQHLLEMKQTQEGFNKQKADLEKEKKTIAEKNDSLLQQIGRLDHENTKLSQENYRLTQKVDRIRNVPWWKSTLATAGIVLGALLCITIIGAYFGTRLIRKSYEYYSKPSNDTLPLDLRDDFISKSGLVHSMAIAPTITRAPSNVNNLEKKNVEGHVTDVTLFKKAKTPPPLLSSFNQNNSANPRKK